MCGIIGVAGKDESIHYLVQGLLHLQHRGQDAAGVLVEDISQSKLHLYKDKGLVNDIFKAETMPSMDGAFGIGHVRYTTSGSGTIKEAQPFLTEHQGLSIGIAYNGNLVNASKLKQSLEEKGCCFDTQSDGEVLLQALAHSMPQSDCLWTALKQGVKKLHEQVVGAYSVVGLIQGKGMFAFRDPQGIRPLVIGREEGSDSLAFASESYPLEYLGFYDMEDLQPGELLFIDHELNIKREMIQKKQARHCSFEYVYFAKANARLDANEASRVRSDLGKSLAEKVRERGLMPDVIIPVPNTSMPAAMSLAWSLGVPLEEGLIRREHSGRTFIMPSQMTRDKAVSQKLAPVASVFRNRTVLLVDDSIVRGTVSRRIVQLAQHHKAKKIIFASTFPPITSPCFYGIDMPDPNELIARSRSIEQIEKEIGADVLVYNSVHDLKTALGHSNLCLACLNGEYPTDISESSTLQASRPLQQALSH